MQSCSCSARALATVRSTVFDCALQHGTYGCMLATALPISNLQMPQGHAASQLSWLSLPPFCDHVGTIAALLVEAHP